MRAKSLTPIAIAAAATLPGFAIWLAGIELAAPAQALISGGAIIGASFLLLWACDAAQADVSRSLALAVVALIAVLPEYAVDMYFTWQAGRQPEPLPPGSPDYAHYAVANMTGANRLLIGVAWGAIAAVFWLRFRRSVRIEGERRTELLFLGLATAYAFLIPLKGTLAWYDGVVFLGLYIWYMVIAGRRPPAEAEAEGPAAIIVALPKARRRLVTFGLFAFSGAAILANAGPFSENLVATGKILRVNEFLLVQWLAPIASETPEFVVGIVFAWRGQAGLALGSLLSAKLNQWTLLVGMIPGVFALSHGSLAHPLPMGSNQMAEITLTAAQSALAVVLLASLRLSVSGALLLFALFVGQLVLPGIVGARHPSWAFGLGTGEIHPLFSLLYIAIAAGIFLQAPGRLLRLRNGARAAGPETCCREEEPEGIETGSTRGRQPAQAVLASHAPPRGGHCANCPWLAEAKALLGKDGDGAGEEPAVPPAPRARRRT